MTRRAITAFMLFVGAFIALQPVTVASAATARAETLHEGTWTKKSYKAGGTWKIVEDSDGFYVELDDDFKTKKAPDLKLFLSPKTLEDLNGKNATDGSVLIAELTSHKGAQRYALPASVNLADFQTIIIHCEEYSKLWSGSLLR